MTFWIFARARSARKQVTGLAADEVKKNKKRAAEENKIGSLFHGDRAWKRRLNFNLTAILTSFTNSRKPGVDRKRGSASAPSLWKVLEKGGSRFAIVKEIRIYGRKRKRVHKKISNYNDAFMSLKFIDYVILTEVYTVERRNGTNFNKLISCLKIKRLF